MVYQIAYCDDELAAAQTFARRIILEFEKQGVHISLTCFNSPMRLLQSICAGCMFDALFLDIDMAEMDGITLCRRLHTRALMPAVVFLSNKDEMVYQTFQVQPVRFLRKSRFATEIGETVCALLRRLERGQSESVVFDNGKQVYRLPVQEISFLEIMNQTLTIHLAGGTLCMKYKMNDAERMLAPYGFLRIHKSYLVNYRMIFSIRKESVLLDNGKELPLSRHRYTEVTMAFLERSRRMMMEEGGV